MKEGFTLLIAALAVAAFSWVFFHYLGQDAFLVLLSMFVVGLAAQNRRLQKQVRELQRAVGSIDKSDNKVVKDS